MVFNQSSRAKAKEIMMLNKRIYADEALRLGLLNLLFKKDFEKNLNSICEMVQQSSLAQTRNNMQTKIKNSKVL